jgi:ketosteroid isomerase-like protein
MRKLFFMGLICCLPTLLPAQDKDKQQILSILDRQTRDWNSGNIDAFMVGYWNNDSLMFIGQSGLTYGYQKTLANYKKNYSDTAQMGKLSFDILEVRKISPTNYFVVGKWFLKRSVGDIRGHYTLLFRKIAGRWVIVADHSS